MEHINFIFLFLSWNRIVQNVLQKLGKVGCFVTFWSSAVDGHKLQNAVNCRIVYVCARIAVGTIRSGLCKLEALPQQLYCVLFSKSTVSVCLSVTASHPVYLHIKSWSFSCISSRHEYYRGADKSLARPGRKQATATENFDVHISYLYS